MIGPISMDSYFFNLILVNIGRVIFAVLTLLYLERRNEWWALHPPPLPGAAEFPSLGEICLNSMLLFFPFIFLSRCKNYTQEKRNFLKRKI